MPALIASRTTTRRAITIVLAAATLTALAWSPSAAHAAGCTDSWAAKGSGSWFVAANWSKKTVPTSEDEVCITEAGSSYTVEMNGTSAVTVKSLTVGGTENTQTLVVASTNSVNAVLTTTGGITNGAHGAITLTNAETSGNNVTVVGPVSNAGKITSEPAHGGQRNLQGSLKNTGTLAINANTSFNGAKALLTNEGAINLATAIQLTASNEGSVTNGSKGKIAATGSGDVLMEPGTSFTEGAGTTSGTKPVILRQASLVYTGSGASVITQHGEGSTLSGNISAGQSLVLETINPENEKTTAAASFTNAGSITMTNAETAGNNVTLAISSGTLTNSGTLTSEKANGGARTLSGSITNTGTLAINANTSFNGAKALLTNEGAINLATAIQLTASNEGSVTNGSKGKIAATGSGDVLMEPGTSFTEGAGTTSGTKPVILRQASLVYTGSGASVITQHGEGSTLSGNISAGQSLVLETINPENEKTTAAASFTNAGSITMTNAETAGNNVTLAISSGTLTNSGTLTSEKANGGARTLSGSITNTGTLAVNTNTSFNGLSALLTNDGALDIAAGKQLIVSNSGSFINGSGGSIVAGEGGNVQVEPGSTFTEGAGTTSGTKPVILRQASLVYTGSGASVITQHGEGSTLSGNISAGQSLVLETINPENEKTTAAASFTNAGSITMTNAETAGNNVTLAISSGTLTNSGTLTTEKAIGGARTLTGNITNTGTIAINANTSFNVSGATLINKGPINIATGVALSAPAKPTISNEAGGSITVTGTGALDQTEGTFNEGLGKTSTAKTSEPVVLDRVALHYTDKGASKIAQRGASTLSGTINKGQTLVIESTNSEHAEDTAAGSFTNSGAIHLTNAETSANNVTLKLGGGTLTNKGTVEVLFPKGGTRTIEGSLNNEKTLTIANNSNPLKVTGTFAEGAKATLKLTIAGATNFGRVVATGAVTVNGTLALKQSKFTAKSGETFAILTGASRTGEFTSVTGNAVKGGVLHYIPHYTATGVNLIVE